MFFLSFLTSSTLNSRSYFWYRSCLRSFGTHFAINLCLLVSAFWTSMLLHLGRLSQLVFLWNFAQKHQFGTQSKIIKCSKLPGCDFLDNSCDIVLYMYGCLASLGCSVQKLSYTGTRIFTRQTQVFPSTWMSYHCLVGSSLHPKAHACCFTHSHWDWNYRHCSWQPLFTQCRCEPSYTAWPRWTPLYSQSHAFAH